MAGRTDGEVCHNEDVRAVGVTGHPPVPVAMPCRFCGTVLRHTVVDLGMSPLCESYVTVAQLNQAETFYPLHVQVCEECFLVQLQEYVSAPEIFREYAYFSSFSTSWVEHARRYCEQATERLGLGAGSLVVELGSNDGYLLQHFATSGIDVLGVEPARNVAAAAAALGIETITEFFGTALAEHLAATAGHADLIVANNVLAQVPDLKDFVAGIALLLGKGGVATVEFPHLARLFAENQFDTIYHEHFSYFSLLSARQVFAVYGLRVFDVEELPTHGGSLRLWVCHDEDGGQPTRPNVDEVLRQERAQGFEHFQPYLSFGPRVERVKRRLLEFLIRARDEGRRVVGYGAPGKGNTLLNYCGIRTDLLEYTVDRNPYKQGMFLPGTHIPIYEPARIDRDQPDYILILPWNLRDEIIGQMAHVRSWGAKFVVPIPEVRVL